MSGLVRIAAFFCLALIFLVTGPLWSFAAVPARERILAYDVMAVFDLAGEMEVVEKITVATARNRIKHGIYRALPIWWNREDHKLFRFEYTVKSLLRDGKPEPYRVETTSDAVKIYAGREDVILPPALYTYILTYTVSNHLSRFEDWDELYWNVTGNGWLLPIDKTRFRLFYRESPEASLQPMPVRSIDVYTGRLGERGKNARVLPDNSIETVSPMERGEGLTIAWTWPRGFLKDAPDPVEYSILKKLFIPKGKSFVLLGVPLLLAAYFLFFVRSRAKTGPMPEVIPLFNVPEGFTPGQLRYMTKLRYDNTSFAADLLHIVAKGAANLTEWKGSWILKRGPGPRRFSRTEALQPGESAAVEELFAKGDSIVVSTASRTVLNKARESLENFVTRKEDAVLIPVLRYIVGGAILQVLGLPLAAMAFISSEGLVVLVGFSIFIGLWIAVLFMVTRHLIRGLSPFFTFLTTLPVLLFLALFYTAVGAMCFYLVPEIISASGLPDGYGSAFLACLVVWITGSATIPRRNAEGRRRLGIARGLAMYLGTAERNRFAALYRPDESVEHFEKLLPYALALDKGETWAGNFRKYLEETGNTGETFTDSSWNGIHSFRSSTAAAVRSLFRSSGAGGFSGSGSSGRGSSGRGGGGGDGGGW